MEFMIATRRSHDCGDDRCENHGKVFAHNPIVKVLDLPDAEHIHLHRRPDGTWHAVPLQPAPVFWVGHQGKTPVTRWLYVDADAPEKLEWVAAKACALAAPVQRDDQ